jgi:4-hydroxy-tetrahydrodipicolinate reductase
MTIRIGLLGADGSMGQMITKIGLQQTDIQFTHAYTISNSPNIGNDLGILVGQKAIDTIIKDTEQIGTDLKTNPPDLIIDFTAAQATEKYAPIILSMGVPMVIGTTGLKPGFTEEIQKIISKKGISIVKATNMATGVNLFFKIAAEIAKKVSDWDIEIIEAHHHRKKDAPSGTAMTTAEKIAEAIGVALEDAAHYGRDKGMNPRKIGKGEIGIHAIRAGDIVGEHTVIYAGNGERIELTHRAHSRECFASGSITAARFLMENKEKGKIFSMQDVLGL